MEQDSELDKSYNKLLLEGERWWNQHNSITLFEIRDCINVMKSSNCLPNCFWEDIAGIHATNYSSLYNLTKRMIEANYAGAFVNIKPNLNFLEWMYLNLLKNNTNGYS